MTLTTAQRQQKQAYPLIVLGNMQINGGFQFDFKYQVITRAALRNSFDRLHLSFNQLIRVNVPIIWIRDNSCYLKMNNNKALTRLEMDLFIEMAGVKRNETETIALTRVAQLMLRVVTTRRSCLATHLADRQHSAVLMAKPYSVLETRRDCA